MLIRGLINPWWLCIVELEMGEGSSFVGTWRSLSLWGFSIIGSTVAWYLSYWKFVILSVDGFIEALLCTYVQVQRDDGSWLDAGTRKDCLIVNLGETFSRMTNRRVKATIHRVKAIGRPRQSVPFFLEPWYHAKVPQSLPQDPKKEMSSVQHPQEDSLEYGPWLKNSLLRFVEWNAEDFEG